MEDTNLKKWNMLDSYREGQVIYGRDAEISAIHESILYNIQTFIYGKSGIGKTSLLQAGVFPKLRQAKYFPVIIRLSFYNNDSLNHVVKRLVEEEAEREDLSINKFRLNHYVIDNTEVLDSPLYEYFSKVRFEDDTHIPYIPVLIFDQFEETINNEEQWQRTVDFLKEDLYDLMDNSNIIHGESIPYTNYRIVFSMREDYLYCLEDIVDRYSLWELRYNRYRIKALDDERASDVIRLTSGTNGLENGKEDKIIKLIIKIVKNNSGSRFTEINTALLSLICSLLHENSIDKCIYYQDLRKINVYLNSYYDNICDEIGGTAANYLEDKLLTKDGRRSSIDEGEIVSSKKVNYKQLDYLVEKRFLRRIKTDSTSIRYEYIHDLFARMIFKRRMDERGQWYIPKLSSISRKLNMYQFIKKASITVIILLLLGYCYGLLMNWKDYGFSLNILDFLIHTRVYLFIFSFILLVYLLPLIIKRLHDVGWSGWWIFLCGLFPMIYSLFLHNGLFNISMGIWYGEIFESIAIGGSCFCFAFIGFLCMRPSVAGANPAKYSKEYEEIFKEVIIDNAQFVKAFLLELSIYIANYCFVIMVIYYYYYDLNYDFQINYNDFLIFKWFGSNFSVPCVLALFPFVLGFSPSLKARIKTIGYPIEIAYIPYFNILLLIVGLFPDQMLHTLKLWREPKIQHNTSEDGILVDIHESFFRPIYENQNYNKKLISSHVKSLMAFIPFYALGRFFNRKLSISERVNSFTFILVNVIILDLLFLLILLIDVTDIVIWVCISILGIEIILDYCLMPYWKLLLARSVINEIEINPQYEINQLATVFGLTQKAMKNIIEKLIKKGCITRVVTEEIVYWKIDTERCIKYKYKKKND